MSTAAAVASGASAGMNIAAPFISYGLNAAAASKAHDRSKNMITRMPDYLRIAGINPMVAYGGKGGVPNAGVPMAAPAQMGQGASSSISTALESKRQHGVLRNIRLQGDLYAQQREESITRAMREAAEVNLTNARTAYELSRAEAAQLELTTERARRSADKSQAGQILNRLGRYGELLLGPVMSAKGALR